MAAAMRITSLITVIALVGFALACGGTTEPAPEPITSVHVEEPGEYDHGEPVGMDPMSAYADSPFEYCDAKVLGAVWGEDTYTAKASIGRFMADNQKALLLDKLSGARSRALDNFENPDLRCSFDEIGITYEDAVLLGEFWGIDSWDAKIRVEEKFLRDAHEDTYIREALREARG